MRVEVPSPKNLLCDLISLRFWIWNAKSTYRLMYTLYKKNFWNFLINLNAPIFSQGISSVCLNSPGTSKNSFKDTSRGEGVQLFNQHKIITFISVETN